MNRECGECTLCCKLLPVRALAKGANERCQHQRRTGCRVYHRPGMPSECALWSCRWLNGTVDRTSRPDRSHLVIDVMPDFVTATDNATGEVFKVEVVQVWCDPDYPDAHRDPQFRAWALKQCQEGRFILIRYNAKDAFPLIADDKGIWHELPGQCGEVTHTPLEIFEALGHG